MSVRACVSVFPKLRSQITSMDWRVRQAFQLRTRLRRCATQTKHKHASAQNQACDQASSRRAVQGNTARVDGDEKSESRVRRKERHVEAGKLRAERGWRLTCLDALSSQSACARNIWLEVARHLAGSRSRRWSVGARSTTAEPAVRCHQPVARGSGAARRRLGFGRRHLLSESRVGEGVGCMDLKRAHAEKARQTNCDKDFFSRLRRRRGRVTDWEKERDGERATSVMVWTTKVGRAEARLGWRERCKVPATDKELPRSVGSSSSTA